MQSCEIAVGISCFDVCSGVYEGLHAGFITISYSSVKRCMLTAIAYVTRLSTSLHV